MMFACPEALPLPGQCILACGSTSSARMFLGRGGWRPGAQTTPSVNGSMVDFSFSVYVLLVGHSPYFEHYLKIVFTISA